MGFGGALKRFALFAVMRLLGIDDLRSQLTQSPHVTNRRGGGAAILAAHLHAAQQGPSDSNPPNRTLGLATTSTPFLKRSPSIPRSRLLRAVTGESVLMISAGTVSPILRAERKLSLIASRIQ